MNFLVRTASRIVSRPLREVAFQSNPICKTGPVISKRCAHNAPLTYDLCREKIMLVLRLFDKIDPYKITLDSHFVDDLGLDSLDHTEIVMMIEDEFNFEIPDKDAEKLMRPRDFLRYLSDKEEAYEELQKLHAAHHHDDHGGHGHHTEAGHGHSEPHGKIEAHHFTSAKNFAENLLNTQKRDFCTLTSFAKRYSSNLPPGVEYGTSFLADQKKMPSFDEIQARVMKVCSKYDKIDSSQLNAASHFVDDLGLDSLDHVEIMMEFEDEFGIEIPDQDAEKLMRPSEIARYVFQKEEGRMPMPDKRPY